MALRETYETARARGRKHLHNDRALVVRWVYVAGHLADPPQSRQIVVDSDGPNDGALATEDRNLVTGRAQRKISLVRTFRRSGRG